MMLTNQTEWNFVHKNVDKSDIQNLFGPFNSEDNNNPNDEIITFDDDTHLQHIAVKLGIFPSLSQARKNGWFGPVPKKFFFRQFQKKQKIVWICGDISDF